MQNANNNVQSNGTNVYQTVLNNFSCLSLMQQYACVYSHSVTGNNLLYN